MSFKNCLEQLYKSQNLDEKYLTFCGEDIDKIKNINKGAKLYFRLNGAIQIKVTRALDNVHLVFINGDSINEFNISISEFIDCIKNSACIWLFEESMDI